MEPNTTMDTARSRRRLRRAMAAACALLLAAGGGAVAHLAFRTPAMRALDETRRVVATAAAVERGRYLVENVTHCLFCHSEHDWGRHGGPRLPGSDGAGWDVPYADNHMPGRVFAPNITPDVETGVGGFPDDAIARAVREGVGRDGHALFMMPWEAYRQLSDGEVDAIVAYLRTIPAVTRRREPTRIDLPVRWLMNGLPRPLTGPVPDRDLSDPVERGRYLAVVGLCHHCHTPVDRRHRPLPGMDFAGGREFVVGGVRTRASNITPAPSGIAHYDEALFIRAMRTGTVGARRLSPVMPWSETRNMTDEDLRALWAYLRTVPAVLHDVTRAPVDVSDAPGAPDAGRPAGQTTQR